MSRLLYVAFVLLAASLPATALQLTPIPGAANQRTQISAFFPNGIGVKATDDAGRPVPGVRVTFTVEPFNGSNGFVFIPGEGFSFLNAVDVVTGGDGVALVLPGVVGFESGATSIVASARDASPVTIALTVLPSGTTRVDVISGSRQHAPVGSVYPKPWIVHATDARGLSVPFAALLFQANDDTLPSVSFNGRRSLWLRADANGIAVSPLPRANSLVGKGEGAVSTLNPDASVRAGIFQYRNSKSKEGAGVDDCRSDRGCDDDEDEDDDD
jgi:hypothetical protein